MERSIGLEPMYADWQSAVLATGRRTLKSNGAGEGNRTLIIGLEDLSSTIELRPQLITKLSKSYGRGARIRTEILLVPGQAG